MSRIKATIAAAALALASALSAGAADYDLGAYLAKVEQENLDLKLARTETEDAKLAAAQALSALLPATAAQGGYTRNLKDLEQSTAVAADLDAAAYGVAPFVYREVDKNFDNEYLLALSVQQKLFSPEAIARYAQAKKSREIREASYELTRRSVLAAAKKLYAAAQLASQSVDAMAATERTYAETYKNARKRFNAGISTELDLLLAESAWKNKIPETAKADRGAREAMLALKTLAGIPLDEPVVLTEKNEDVPPLPEARSVDQVLDARPDYRISELSKEIADIARKAAFASFLPSVDGSYTYAMGEYKGYVSSGDSSEYSTAQLGLKVTVPLFTGGYRLALMKQAKLAQEKADINIEKKRIEIELNLLSVELKLKEAYRRIDSALAAESAASRASALAQTSFANGLATQLTVDNALTQQQAARLGLYNARYEYRAAYYDWEIAVGEED